MLIIADRLAAEPGSVWTEFAAANPDLFESPSVLGKYYAPETLASDRARRGFVLPDAVTPVSWAEVRRRLTAR